jgi:hypothetical protein
VTTDLREYTLRSFKNRVALAEHAECSCYSCQQVIEVSKVKRYVDGGQTALCPECLVDALLPGRMTPSELAFIHYLFTR